MNSIIVQIEIEAPVDIVFNSVADIREFSKALPHVASYEFLNNKIAEVGSKFKETRIMNGKPQINELEITEFIPNEIVRINSENHGTVWDTVFTTNSENETTILTLEMEARSSKVLLNLLNKIIMGMVKKAVIKDLEYVKLYCENNDLS